MKTKVENALQENQKLVKDFFKLIPPRSHRFSISNGNALAKDMRNIISQYTPTLMHNPLQIFRDDFFVPPYRQPLYGEFLIHAQTLHNQEPLGTFLFSFKQQESSEASVDTLFSPVSMFRVCGLDAKNAPCTHRIANIWYASDADFFSSVPNLQKLIETHTLHNFLTPVGPLVQSINSTFLNKVTTVVRGEILTKKSPPENIKVLFPADMFYDLDEVNLSYNFSEPTSNRACYYACVLYVLCNNRPAVSLMFFRSVKGHGDVMRQIKHFLSDAILASMKTVEKLALTHFAFGAVCMLGHSCAQINPTKGSLYFRSSLLQTVEIPDFVSDPKTWILL
ncbi:capsid triplex subunit 1 [Vespertilionid gammaherpesvirus 1]|uniref:Capsid triplex subunit 1 n=1 Tax=Vespertilionid gammaherpesvirus 1 TaxID=2560830 RepID=A0A120HQN1_9GAMA|nr:capsid triplex subunit 1 [Myotis gammaherpesvirus 8]AMA67419.1 capsid triplex subunit 1 [Vespertilionid gammaherpesvirus 1]